MTLTKRRSAARAVGEEEGGVQRSAEGGAEVEEGERTGAEIRNAITAEEKGGLVGKITVWAGGATLVVSEATVGMREVVSRLERS